MLGKQASDERLYPKREDKGRGLKSMRDVYNETRLGEVERWIQVASRRETLKVEHAIVSEAWTTTEKVCVRLKFQNKGIQLGGDMIEQEWKLTWKREKTAAQKSTKQIWIETYQAKDQQSRSFREQEEECHPQNSKSSPIIYHDNAGTNGGKWMLEGNPRSY